VHAQIKGISSYFMAAISEFVVNLERDIFGQLDSFGL